MDYSDDQSISQFLSMQRKQDQQCKQLLQNLDIQKQTHRQWVAKHYRKLNSIMNQNSQMKFYLTPQSKQIPNKVVKYAFSLQPYQFDQGIQTFSRQCCQSNSGKRKCQKPLIFKSGNGVWEAVKLNQFNMANIRENNRFNLKIQAEQHSTIIITYQNSHPLRVKPQFRQYFRQNALIQVSPPTTIGIVVTKQQEYTIDSPFPDQPQKAKVKTFPFKLPSNYIKLQINKSGGTQGQSNFMRRLGDEYMIRPQETFDHGLSNSQGSNWHPFVTIQTQSRSRD